MPVPSRRGHPCRGASGGWFPSGGRAYAALVVAAVLVTACSPSASGAPGSHLTLTAADNGKTFVAKVPLSITVDLPYDPSTGKLWELVSGGAGFSSIRPPVIMGASVGHPGHQIFSFRVTGKNPLPIVLDSAKPGPLPPNSTQFKVTIEGN